MNLEYQYNFHEHNNQAFYINFETSPSVIIVVVDVKTMLNICRLLCGFYDNIKYPGEVPKLSKGACSS